MTTTTPKLSDLSQRIARQEAQLASLRQQLDTHLADLNRRREALRLELRAVEAELAAVSSSGPPQQKPAPAPKKATKPVVSLPAQPTKSSSPSLPEFLLQIVREAKGQPVTLAYLQQETVRRRFPTKSLHVPEMVGARVSDMVKQGRLRRDPRTGGLLVVASQNGNSASGPPTAPPRMRADRRPKPKPAKSSPTTQSPAGIGGNQLSLRAVLVGILKNAGRTLSAEELAARAKQAGYPSSHKPLKELIWRTMGRIPEVEHDPRGGYRLKKPKH
jgi:hypothetical protein